MGLNAKIKRKNHQSDRFVSSNVHQNAELFPLYSNISGQNVENGEENCVRKVERENDAHRKNILVCLIVAAQTVVLHSVGTK